ncbi:MAG: hypothetical protein IJQ48_02255 [Prevotella sp.]|nr:hypothetical protein [Prevotella sp.]
MGFIDLDDVASFAIGKTEEKLQGKEKEEKTTIGGFILRFIISIIWFVIAAIATIGGAVAMTGGEVATFLGDERGPELYVIGIGLCLAVFIITFLVPFLRKKGSFTRWCGIVCLGDALWWIYLLISNGVS